MEREIKKTHTKLLISILIIILIGGGIYIRYQRPIINGLGDLQYYIKWHLSDMSNLTPVEWINDQSINLETVKVISVKLTSLRLPKEASVHLEPAGLFEVVLSQKVGNRKIDIQCDNFSEKGVPLAFFESQTSDGYKYRTGAKPWLVEADQCTAKLDLN